MILAAGRGERLRPLTDHVPKPLVTIDGVSLLERHLNALAESGVERVVINVAHLASDIRKAIETRQDANLEILFSTEPEGALETAGGIARALPLLGDAPFLVINGDVVCDVAFDTLELADDCLMHLLLVDNPPHHPDGDFGLDRDTVPNRLVAPDADGPSYTFAGVGCYRPELFVDLPDKRYPLAPLIRQCIAAGSATAEHYSGNWFDIGSAGRLERARRSFGDYRPATEA